MSMKKYYGLASMAMALALASQDGESMFYTEKQKRDSNIVCGMCEHCPINGKTFCREAKHSTTKYTAANKCKFLKIKKQ